MTNSSRIVFAVCMALSLVAAGCGADDGQQTVSATGVPPVSSVADVGQVGDLPGYPATKADGCSPDDETIRSFGELADWVPINSVVNSASFAVQVQIADISNPRVNHVSLDSAPPGSGIYYFRILTLEVIDGRGIDLQSAAPPANSRIVMVLAGAGPNPSEDLCYGPDGVQDPREVSLSIGDRLFVLLTKAPSPKEDWNTSGDIFLPSFGGFGYWKVLSGEKLESVTPEYGSLSFEKLQARVKAEFESGPLTYDELSHVDALSTRPKPQEEVATTSTTPPTPPGALATDSPTVTTAKG